MFVVAQMRGTVATVTIALRAVSKLKMRCIIARDSTRAARVHNSRRGLQCLRMVAHPPMSVFHLSPNVPAKKQQIITDRSQDHGFDHPRTGQERKAITDPLQQCEPFDFYRQDKKYVDREVGEKPRERKEHSAEKKAARCRQAGLATE